MFGLILTLMGIGGILLVAAFIISGFGSDAEGVFGPLFTIGAVLFVIGLLLYFTLDAGAMYNTNLTRQRFCQGLSTYSANYPLAYSQLSSDAQAKMSEAQFVSYINRDNIYSCDDFFNRVGENYTQDFLGRWKVDVPSDFDVNK